MLIRFVNPRMNRRPADTEIKFKLLPPQSLLLLAALTPKEHKIELLDENLRAFRHDDNPDLVAMPVYIAAAKRAYAIAEIYRSRGVKVVLGGIHATCRTHEAIQHADSVVVGEADRLWSRVLEDAKADRLSPIYTETDAVDLSGIPHLQRSLCKSRFYASVNTMRATRGCPHRCRFCYQSAFYKHRGVRHRSIQNILGEIRAMRSNHVLFLDDNIIGDRRFARQLFRALTDLRITWSAAASVDIADNPDLLSLARQSGCRTLFIGFESISQSGLAHNGKTQNRVTAYDEAVDMIHRHGIMINGSFILGMRDDTPESIRATVDWINSRRVETATFHILTPYPGTPLFDEFEREGRIIDYDWDHYNTANVVFRPEKMTPEELKAGYDRAYREIYSWRSIMKRFPRNAPQRLPYLAFVLGYKKFSGLTHWLGRIGMMSFMFDVVTHLFQKRRVRPRLVEQKDEQKATKGTKVVVSPAVQARDALTGERS